MLDLVFDYYFISFPQLLFI